MNKVFKESYGCLKNYIFGFKFGKLECWFKGYK
ncbi:hypothetical protein BAN_0900015 [Borrelia anserina BA2]|uniref:Uncharacterized protein n=1 Tax=Borrelia anserina BA2 TaxID=1313293 RepID=W5SQ39_BORAN|nr:hypothetical protein BAN_0900015 [Borrelia anserina BA2]